MYELDRQECVQVLQVPQVLLDASTHGTLVLIAVLGMGDAEDNKLFAESTKIPLSALPGV